MICAATTSGGKFITNTQVLLKEHMRKQSGYTHTISWTEKHRDYGTVPKSFRTTKDAVDLHLKAMKSTGLCNDITVAIIPVVNSPFKF